MDKHTFDAQVPLRDPSGAESLVTLSCSFQDLDPRHAPPECRIRLIGLEREFEGAGPDFFEALCRLREQLEPSRRVLVCYGASRNVWPSGMCRDMGTGLRAYRLTSGTQTSAEDLVDILATGPDVQPATVAEQRAFCLRLLDPRSRTPSN